MPTQEEANARALLACRTAAIRECEIKETFRDEYLVLALTAGYDFITYSKSSDPMAARLAVLGTCKTKLATCVDVVFFEDRTPAFVLPENPKRPAPIVVSPAQPNAMYFWEPIALATLLLLLAVLFILYLNRHHWNQYPHLLSRGQNLWNRFVSGLVLPETHMDVPLADTPQQEPPHASTEYTPPPSMQSATTPPASASTPSPEEPIPPAQSKEIEPVSPQQNLPAVIPPATAIPATMPPPQGMALKLKRSEKQSFTGKPVFMLDARMEVSADIRQRVIKYRLGKRVVYESSNRQKYADAANRHLAASGNDTSLFAPPAAQAKGIAKTFFQLGRAGVSGVIASLSLRITIDSLCAGVHVECKSMEELLEAEEAITVAARNLKSYVEVSTTFSGQEEIVEL
jgi:hypothetical protein